MDKAILVELPLMNAPFKTCAPHADSKKVQRQLTLDFSDEKTNPMIQELRTFFGTLTARIQVLLHEKAVKDFPNLPPLGSMNVPEAAWTQPTQLISCFPPNQSSIPGFPAGFPPPPTAFGFPPVTSTVTHADGSVSVAPNGPPIPVLQRGAGQVLQTTIVAPIVQSKAGSDWPDKVVLKFQPNTVAFTGESSSCPCFFCRTPGL